jgi:hypothetical protein
VGSWFDADLQAPLVVNGQVSISPIRCHRSLMVDATLASAFVARWYLGAKVKMAGGLFQVRKDQPELRVGAALQRTP